MSQATDAQRALMDKYFGDPISDSGPMQYLLDQGFKFPRGGMILPPTPGHKLTEKEGDCIDFLCDEWDYGWDPNFVVVKYV